MGSRKGIGFVSSFWFEFIFYITSEACGIRGLDLPHFFFFVWHDGVGGRVNLSELWKYEDMGLGWDMRCRMGRIVMKYETDVQQYLLALRWIHVFRAV